MKDCAVVFVHGLAKKPAPAKLEEIWRWGLGRDDPRDDVFPNPNPGIDLNVEGVPAFFTYYADVFYGENYESDLASYYEADNAAIQIEDFEAVAGDLAAPVPANQRERLFLQKFEAKMQAQLTPAECGPFPGTTRASSSAQLEIASWLPQPVKHEIIKRAAMEAYYFLFNKEYRRADGQTFRVRDELRNRLMASLKQANDAARSVVLVTHSMGTMVGYDVLRNCTDCPPVHAFFTLGSPLGVQEVQDELRAQGRATVDFPAAKVGSWINVYDPLDPVCAADPRFVDDYEAVQGKQVEDVRESNWGSWRHTITHYLAGKLLRARLAQALGA